MAVTIPQLANLGLNQNQQNKLEAFRAIGAQLGSNSPAPDIGGLTLSNAKTVLNFVNDLQDLLGTIRSGASYVRSNALQAATQAADDAAPTGTL